jgi:hypothetical protein
MWTAFDFVLTAQAEHNLFAGTGRSERGFRKLLANLSTRHDIGLPPDFFGYTEEGEPNPKGEATIIMAYTRRGLRLVGIGHTACALLRDKIGSIHAAMMTHANSIIRVARRSGQHAVDLTPFAKPYYLKSLMLGKAKAGSFWIRAADAVKAGSSWETEVGRILPKMIGQHLLRQLVQLHREADGVDGNVMECLAQALHGEESWQDAGQAFGRRLGIQVHRVGGHTFAKVGAGGGRVVLKDIEFTMKANFEGPWFLGRHRIEGNGELQAATGAWTQARAAA